MAVGTDRVFGMSFPGKRREARRGSEQRSWPTTKARGYLMVSSGFDLLGIFPSDLLCVQILKGKYHGLSAGTFRARFGLEIQLTTIFLPNFQEIFFPLGASYSALECVHD